jgi:prepilin-type N-terminal cleavage/methylation domain-containing protein
MHTILLSVKKGYTLIEMAIVVLVAGVVIASGAEVYRIYHTNQARTTTTNNVSSIAQSIGGFLIRFGRYPCPADISRPRTDPSYGMETGCDPTNTSGEPTYVTTAAGSCWADGGICIQSAPAPLPNTLLVRRGAIPFRSMNIPESMTFDAYGDRLQYAVTEPLAVTNTYSPQGGGINVNDQTSGKTATGVHFVIFSSGPDQAGAYSRDGGLLVASCGTTNVATSDAQNCTTSGAAVFNIAQYNANAGSPNHDDDTLQFFTSMAIPLWKPQGQSQAINNIHDTVQTKLPSPSVVPPTNPQADPNCIDPSGCRVGVGVPDPTTALDVAKNNTSGISVQASGSLQTSTLCDNASPTANCLTSSVIAGNDSSMTCPKPNIDPPNAVYVIGISNNQVQCSAVQLKACGQGQFMAGINKDGSLNCQAVNQNCSAGLPQSALNGPAPLSAFIGCDLSGANSNLEYVAFDPTVWLPAAQVNTTASVPMATIIQNTNASTAQGNIAQQDMQAWLSGSSTTPGPQYTLVNNYQCVGGQWTYTGNNGGWCGCEPTTTPTTLTCSQLANNYYNWGAGAGFTGLGTVPVTETVSTWGPGPGGVACGWASNNTTYTFSINGTTYGPYLSQTAMNAAMPALITACSAGQCTNNTPAVQWNTQCSPWGGFNGYNTGGITMQNTWSCGVSTNGIPGGWTGATTMSNTCGCASSNSQNAGGCPAGYTGSITTETDTTCTGSGGVGSTIASSTGPYVFSNTCTYTCPAANTVQFKCNDPLVQAYDLPAYSTTDNIGSVIMQQTYNCATQSYSATWAPVPGGNTCGCSSTTQTQYIPCTGGQAGQQTQTRNYNCTTGANSGWTTTSSTCAPPGQGNWNAASSAAGPYPNNPTTNPLGGGPCTQGTVAACSTTAPGGSGYTYYQTCYCQQ